MTKKRGLGRGLNALISETVTDSSIHTNTDEENVETTVSRETKEAESSSENRDTSINTQDNAHTIQTSKFISGSESGLAVGTLQLIKIEEIQPDPHQPRRDFDKEALQSLADSISSKGLLQPIVVNQLEKHRYRIVAGERRWRAAKLAGLKELPSLVREMEDEDVLQVALIENIQREDLNVIEEAEAYRRLTEEFYYTHQEISRLIGKSRSHISNTLRLLQLPDEIQMALIDRIITPGHARALLSLNNSDDQALVVREIEQKQLNVRQTERLVERLLRDGQATAQPEQPSSQRRAQFLLAVQSVEEELTRNFGTKVKLKAGKGRGQIIVDYYSHEDLERLLHLFGVTEDFDTKATQE